MNGRFVPQGGLLVLCLVPLSCTGLLGGSGESDGGQTSDGQFVPGQDVDRSEPFDGPIVSGPGESVRLYRLTHAQYDRTITTLLRLEGTQGLAELFVAEPLITTFDTDATLLGVSSDLRRDYERAAEAVAELLVQDEAILRAAVGDEVVDSEDAAGFIDSLGPRAFRRPLTSEEKANLTSLFAEGASLVESGDAFLDGVFTVTTYLLQSPHFLYRAELSTDVKGERIPLGPYEVAAKLAYSLTGTMPDDELFAAAESGALTNEAGVEKEVARLLETDAARQVVRDFHYQLLKMREYAAISKDTSAHPAFGDGAAEDLVTEGLTFVEHVVFDVGLGLDELLTAPYTFANTRVAEMYGLAVPAGASDTTFALLSLPDDERAGLLTQIGFLAAHGEGTTPNSILRGVNVAHNILCIDLPPPPDDVPPLAAATGDTNRARVEDLTKDPGCASCHATFINPLGFAFEALDGVGAARTQDSGFPVDASATYKIDGQSKSYDGVVEFMQLLVESAQAHDCYARHWAEFLFGRALDMNDDVDEGLAIQGGWLSQSDASVRELIRQLVLTDAFLTRSP